MKFIFEMYIHKDIITNFDLHVLNIFLFYEIEELIFRYI